MVSELSPHSSVTAPEYIEGMKNQLERARPWVVRLAKNRLRYYERLLERRPKRILEIGAGTGWMVKAYQEEGIEAAGVELDPQLIEYAQSQLGLKLIEADINLGELSDAGEFDVVFSSQTVEHIHTPRKAITNMAKSLRDGGLLHIDVPNANSWGSRVRRIRHGRDNWGAITLPAHQVGYFPESMSRLLSDASFEIIEVSERPTDDHLFGQTILPVALRSRAAIFASRILGHGYLLVAIGKKTARAAESDWAERKKVG
jgi:2-polyprenyl-3-methyl-5-hydroxy-6-metoxy-1,4-benzoquinol methylase